MLFQRRKDRYGKKDAWGTTWQRWETERDHLLSVLYIGGGAGSKEKKSGIEDRKRHGKARRRGGKGNIENASSLFFVLSPSICSHNHVESYLYF